VSPESARSAGEGVPDHGLLQRVSAIDVPVFVANGDSDPMMAAALLLSARRTDSAQVGIY
jgi:hypothetical protein